MIIIIDLETERARRKTRELRRRRFASIPDAIAGIDANPEAYAELYDRLSDVLHASKADQAPAILATLLALVRRFDRKQFSIRDAKAVIAHYLTAINETDECQHDDAS